MDNTVVSLIVSVAALVFSVVVHEVAHGTVAYFLGDTTARDNGRLTLNPLPHIDPIWTIVMPVIFFFSMGAAFGGAKPVPVNVFNLRKPRRDMMLVSLAGPAANFAIALLSLLVLAVVMRSELGIAHGIGVVMVALYQINLLLIAFNLIPIPPLDGSRVVTGLLPRAQAEAYARLEPYGLMIIMALLFTGLLRYLYVPLWRGLNALLQLIVPLS